MAKGRISFTAEELAQRDHDTIRKYLEFLVHPARIGHVKLEIDELIKLRLRRRSRTITGSTWRDRTEERRRLPNAVSLTTCSSRT